MDHSKCIALIKLYKSKEPLWNVRDPNYRNKSVREMLWREISEEMKMPLYMLKRKMTILLASYRSERYRMKKARQSASAGVSTYKSKWFAYNEFNFMTSNFNDTVDTLPDEYRTTRSTETSGFESQDTDADAAVQETRLAVPPEAPAQHRTRKPRTEPALAAAAATEHNHALLQGVFDILKSSACATTDSYVTFGVYIANELRKYDPTTLAQVKHAINNVIFEADMGRYSCGSRRVDNPATSGPTIGSVLSTTPSMFLAKQENEENEAMEVAAIQHTPDYFS